MLTDLKSYSELMDKCSHCAFCEATCPVFLSDLLETHVARSRMLLIRESMVEENLPVSERIKEIVNRCLLCSNCKQTCPANVPVDEIVIAARYQLYNGKRMNLPKRVLLKKIMENRGLKGLLKKAEALAKTVGISPKEIPVLPKKSFDSLYKGTYTPQGKVRAKAAYFVGCATNTIYPDTADAVMKVLEWNGIEVTLPEGIVCCGIPALVEGDLKTAREMMETNIKALADLEVDIILTDCTSCGLTFKEKLLKVIPTDDPLFEKAVGITFKIREVTDYLNEIGLVDPPPELPVSYTYHVPCHGNWTPTLNDAPRELLSKIPASNLLEMDEPGKCCGAGGTFFIDYKELAENIRDPKIKDITETGADTVITQCPSCRSYLNSALHGKTVMHPMMMLAKAYRLV
ncbi:(Fe-S)-binding protein [bacterium]|nr:(Fe-S)-binding protein [bacterium]